MDIKYISKEDLMKYWGRKSICIEFPDGSDSLAQENGYTLEQCLEMTDARFFLDQQRWSRNQNLIHMYLIQPVLYRLDLYYKVIICILGRQVDCYERNQNTVIQRGENDNYVELWKTVEKINGKHKYYGRYTYGDEGTWYSVCDPLGYCELNAPMADSVIFICCDDSGNEVIRYSNADGNKLPKFENVIKINYFM